MGDPEHRISSPGVYIEFLSLRTKKIYIFISIIHIYFPLEIGSHFDSEHPLKAGVDDCLYVGLPPKASAVLIVLGHQKQFVTH